MNTIDVRSDTVTRPTPQMLEAMFSAKVGDDVFGEDETVNTLQQKAADLFGMEAALFCSSGTLTNQLAIKLHTQPADEVVCSSLAHIYLYEGGGIAFNSGASVRLLYGERGMFNAEQVLNNINNPADVHFPVTRMVAVENTMNKGGGCCWDMEELKRIKQVCVDKGLAFHLDGARLFNALVAKKESAKDYGKLFDTISICLSKGLGAPVGSLLLGKKEHISKARRFRKVMGGGMRQVGYLAAAGIYALDHHVERLTEDHIKAAKLENVLQQLNYIDFILPVETNIVIFKLKPEIVPDTFTAYLLKNNIKASGMGNGLFRMVMHLDITAEQFDYLEHTLKSFPA
jgi:threonine aldolase